VQFGLDVPHALVRLLQHREVQALLAAEVVVDHPLAGLRERGDLVDARTGQPLLAELRGGDLQDVGLGALRIVGAGRLLRRRLRGAAAGTLRVYQFVHFASIGAGAGGAQSRRRACYSAKLAAR
jgi:hypothetical protein